MSVPPSKRGLKGKGQGDQFIALGTTPAPSIAAPPKSTKRDAPPSGSCSVAKKQRVDKPINVESYELLGHLEREGSEDKAVGCILSSLSSVKASRGKDSLIMLTLLYHGKLNPSSFRKYVL